MMQKYKQKYPRTVFLVFFLITMPFVSVFSQAKRYKIYDDYISLYKEIAIGHMKKYKIPASITLAQGLVESGAGKSQLAKQSNNHFGIKCHKDWKGGKVYHDDDLKNECFRKYKKVEDSYEDHAQFIVGKQRYAFLFSLEITDYRGWAKGLQKAGYATDKAYANKLIKIIEDYELYDYDKKDAKKVKVKDKVVDELYVPTFKHVPYKTHNLIYVVAENGDTYESIAFEFGFKVKELCKYNEVPETFPLEKGDLVYFQKKKSKADKPYYEHIVQIGESMYSISQLYGIKVKSLYKMNKKDFEYVPVEGDILKLR